MTTDTQSNDRYSPTIGIDAIHEILKSDRRRYLLRELQHDSPRTADGMINGVTAREYGSDYTDTERKRVRVSLHQAHLPKLIEHRAVVDTGDYYELGPTAAAIIEVLDCSERATRKDYTPNDPDGDRQYSSVSSWLKKAGLN